MSTPRSPQEIGWLPDCVYAGQAMETGLAFFADGLGRITRFSREPADLAAAKRLAGQCALPGLVNGHSRSLHRVLRGRALAGYGAPAGTDPFEQACRRLDGTDFYDAARLAFMEMLLAGITCVGEFHGLHRRPDGTPYPEDESPERQILQAAHDTGIRISLIRAIATRPGFHRTGSPAEARFLVDGPDRFIAETDALNAHASAQFPADEAWLGVGPLSLRALRIDHLKPVAAYAHARRMRLHIPLSLQAEDNEACLAEHRRTPAALLADNGMLGKRVTAIHAARLAADDIALVGGAKTNVCACPGTERSLGAGPSPVGALAAAGASISLGTGGQNRIDLLEEARLLDGGLGGAGGRPPAPAAEAATALFHAATVAGARSLGGPGGALEVGRPADFFTVNLFDPGIAGAEPESLLATVLLALERRAIREVWIGARQRIAGGRHLQHGPVIGRFVDLQKKLWGSGNP